MPELTAVTSPLPSTQAISGFLLLHVTDLFAALDGETVAVNCMVSPCSNSTVFLFSEIPVARMTLDLTVTSHLAETPLFAVQVMVVVPAAFAVNNPLLFISATDVLVLFHVSVVVALLSMMTGLNVCVSPMFNDSLSGMLMEVTS